MNHPKPIVKKMFWPYPLIWAVPVAAAILTAYFMREKFQIRGPEITIQFTDGTNLKPGQTIVEIHGVQVGEVTAVELTPDQKHALVHVSLHRDEAPIISRKDTQFWVVRPEVSFSAISGLGAILSGPYIEVRPGEGEPASQFIGLDSPPPAPGKGIHVVLVADRLEHVQPDTPVAYRGIQIGAVQDIRLSDQSDQVNVTVFIQERYAPLLHVNSQFWASSGADIHGGVFTGVKVKLDSLSSILSGRIEFATPEKDPGPFAQEGSTFVLHDELDKDWLSWKAKIPLPPENAPSLESQTKSDESKEQLPAVGTKEKSN